MTYSYYEDHYNNEYRWSTTKESDGKFHAKIMKYRSERGWAKYRCVKDRAFKLRKTAKAYCLNAVRKAKTHQAEVLKRRSEAKIKRKTLKLAKEPKGKEKSKIEYAKKAKHVKGLIAKIDLKIKALDSKRKALETRKKNYQKKHKYYVKAFVKVREQLYDEVDA